MMQLPNVTCILQMVHFLLAYAILKKLIFDPALTIIAEQVVNNNYWKENIDLAQEMKQRLSIDAKNKWALIKKNLLESMPSLIPISFKHSEYSKKLDEQKLTLDQQNQLKNYIKKEIMDQI